MTLRTFDCCSRRIGNVIKVMGRQGLVTHVSEANDWRHQWLPKVERRVPIWDKTSPKRSINTWSNIDQLAYRTSLQISYLNISQSDLLLKEFKHYFDQVLEPHVHQVHREIRLLNNKISLFSDA